MANPLDIIVFGATGFTGKFTLAKVHKFAKADGRNLTWGVAGRSNQKLKDVLAETSKRIGENLSSVPIIIADITDEESIKQMTARARILVNCCGPYDLYGEIVVKSCIETGTHHVDVTGEPTFMEGMELKYRKAAEEKGVYIVSACGFDSIPSDLGVVFLEKNFQGTLNSVEVYVHSYEEGEPGPGPKLNYATWASLVNGIGTYQKLMSMRKKLYPNPLPKFHPKLSLRFPLRRVKSKWALPFVGPDRDVIIRSQRYFYEQERRRPIQAHCYVLVDSFLAVLMIIFFGLIVVILALFQFGRNLLLQYPKFFSGGLFSHEHPSEQALKCQHFSFTLEGEGWSEKLAEGEDQYKTPPNKAIVGRVSGTNPGYDFSCVALTLCAIMILTEPKKLPAKGGVYTTAAAFSKTSLIEQLQKNGVTFEILSSKDI